MPDLKPCPFCGSTSLAEYEIPPHRHHIGIRDTETGELVKMPDSAGEYVIECSCVGMIGPNRDEVRERWNRRA